MKKCTKCGWTTNNEEQAFCEKCGSPLVSTNDAAAFPAPEPAPTPTPKQDLQSVGDICPKCGEEVAAHYKFCSYCGYDLVNWKDNIGDWQYAHMTTWGKVKSVLNVFFLMFLMFIIFSAIMAFVLELILRGPRGF